MTSALLAAAGSSGDVLADRRFDYAMALAAEGDHAAAADLLRQALDLAPRWAAAWVALGEAAEQEGDTETATAAYAAAEECPGGDALGAGVRRARLDGRRHDPSLPAAYVAALFDDYAPRFDAHLLGRLGYRGPAVILDALAGAGAPSRFASVLDLGCGTGLMGRAIRPQADRLCGVDLSAAMVKAALASGVYDAVAVKAIEDALGETSPGSLDLVLAADVFVYCGDLRPVMVAVARAIRPGGLTAFTLQRGDEPVRLGDDLRVTHSEDHVRDALHRAGLAPRIVAAASTRRERGMEVPGLVVVAAKP